MKRIFKSKNNIHPIITLANQCQFPNQKPHKNWAPSMGAFQIARIVIKHKTAAAQNAAIWIVEGRK